MGNEESHYSKIEIDDEAVEVTDRWSLYCAREVDSNVNVHSAFVSVTKNEQENQPSLERLVKNLMIYRHPCIVKFISSWTRCNKLYLITEEVKPLALILPSQSALEICIGLQRILTAIVFLHEKAKAAHNNICCASIYVTPEGIWKLGGLEYLRKFPEVTPAYLQESRSHRYDRAIPPEENSLFPNGKVNAEAIDKYAFGVLVEELLKKKSSDEISSLAEFRDYCKKKLQASSPNERVSLSEVLAHQFFNHEFIKISMFLFDLPLKTSEEKEKFFRNLSEQLHLLPEDVVGSQLASLLLSRVVLLDVSAQKHLLPAMLQPKLSEKQNEALFCENIFKKFVVPKLLQIFCVRDSQIRLILLNHFHLFCDSFTEEHLRERVLPELLVGIKDTDDELVSMTLKALSQLVRILGAATVIGGKRSKLFTDGRPKQNAVTVGDETKLKDKNRGSPSKTPDLMFARNLPERPSPDGGEDNTSPPSVLEGEGDTETWSDWDGSAKTSPEMLPEVKGRTSLTMANPKNETRPCRKSLPDITELDIKSNTENGAVSGEIEDFFRDMEPVISKTQILSINSSKTKFDVESDEVDSNWEGWGEDWELEEVP